MKKNTLRLLGLSVFSLVVLHCGKDTTDPYTEPETPASTPTLSVSNLTTSINENPETGTLVGRVQVSSNMTDLVYEITSQSDAGAISINPSNGDISIANASLFDYESRMVVTAVVRVTGGSLSEEVTITIAINDVTEVDASSLTLWDGAVITFSKENGADHSAAENQDRITDRVWITRAGAGQLFNIQSENAANSNTSPQGTEWAQGTFDDIETLQFSPFRDACPNGKPKNAVGVPMVVHLVEDDVYIELTLISWGQGKVGGFAYERSTQP